MSNQSASPCKNVRCEHSSEALRVNSQYSYPPTQMNNTTPKHHDVFHSWCVISTWESSAGRLYSNAMLDSNWRMWRFLCDDRFRIPSVVPDFANTLSRFAAPQISPLQSVWQSLSITFLLLTRLLPQKH